MATETSEHHKYYVPEPSPWPFMLTVSLFFMLGSGAFWLNGSTTVAPYFAALGLAMTLVMVFIWFRDVVNENLGGVYGVVFRGRRYDTGDKLDYLKAIVQLASDRSDLGPDFRPWLKEFAATLTE